jgi:hypothetical protein
MENPILKIAQALKTNKRIVMVQTLQNLSGEEFETTEDVWSVAEESKKQLRNRLFYLLLYYQKEQDEKCTS